MTRTLADMTPAERAACVGRWCEHKHPLYTGMEVIVSVDVTGVNTYSPRNGWEFLIGDAMLGNLTPRLDLPLAWTPDGEPVPGEWEESTSTPGIRRWCARWEMKPDEQATEETPDSPQPGEAWLIEYEGKRYEAVYWYSPIYAHWAFVEDREGLKTIESPEATPVSRLLEGGNHKPR